MAKGPDARWFVLSDHGQCHEQYALNVNGVLRDLGFVTLRGENADRTLRVPPWLRRLNVDDSLRPVASAIRSALRARLDVELMTPRRAAEVDRLRSRAYSPTVASYAIYGDLDVEVAEVKDALTALRLPDGRRAVDGVWTCDELYGRTALSESPTLLFSPANGVRPSTSAELPSVRPVSRPGRGAHQRDGIVMIHGPGVLQGTLGRVSLYDIAPTLAWAMGSAILGGGDGRILYEAFEPAERTAPPSASSTPRRAPGGDLDPDDEVVSAAESARLHLDQRGRDPVALRQAPSPNRVKASTEPWQA